jgi:hypothetical protein
MNEAIEGWGNDLRQFILAALNDFGTQGAEQMEQFAVDCHPWNGSVILAFLTTSEVEESPFLAEAGEMAAWKFYDFASARSSTHPDIGLRMKEIYNQANDKAKCAAQFFMACAETVASKPIQDILSKYNLSKSFKITISHPDTWKEYYPPT